MTRRINKLQINAQEASNNQILVARGGALVFDDASNVFVVDSQEANAAQTANFANTAGFANVSLESNFANTAGFANVSLESNVANTVVTLSNFTTDDLAESTSNLYFTNARAIAAVQDQQLVLSNITVESITANTWNGLIAGDGITIEPGGRISSTPEYLILSFSEAASSLGTANFSNLKVFESLDGTSPTVYSMHATNMSGNTAYLTVRVTPVGQSSLLLANLLQIPGESSVEILRTPQVFKENDRIEIRSFDSSGAPASNTVSVYMSYSTSEDPNYERSIRPVTDSSELVLFESSGRTSRIESIKIVNTEPVPNKVSIYIKTDLNDIFGWITSNISIPPHSLIEVCEYPKALPRDYSIVVRKL